MKNSLSSSERSCIESVIAKLRYKRKYKHIRRILIDEGFRYITRGGYKAVFKKPGVNYCVKVFVNESAWRVDCYRIPKELKKYYLVPIYQNKRYLIQKWARQTSRKNIIELPDRAYDFLDVCDDNIKVDGNREVVIDFCS